MKPVARSILWLLAGAVAAALIQIILAQILPWPLSALNALAPAIVLAIRRYESGGVVWAALLAAYIIELYSAAPFGVILAPSVLATLGVYWLYLYLFTNRSWYAAVSLAGIWLIIYRVLFAAGLLGVSLGAGEAFIRSWPIFFWRVLAEIAITLAATLLIIAPARLWRRPAKLI